MTPAEQAQLRILRIVDAGPPISQRQFAERLVGNGDRILFRRYRYCSLLTVGAV